LTPSTVDVISLTQELIRFDTSNPPGRERAAIEHLAALLEQAGIEPTIVARDPDRPNLVARLVGRGEAPAILMHGHVDVIPARAEEWEHAPFAAEIIDGELWGRGAIDMKSAVAQMTVAFVDAAVEGHKAPGDVVLAAFADEECGSDYGARFVIDEHPELLEGVAYALGEIGAFSIGLLDRRFYPVQVSEKQWCVLRLSTSGKAGHGSVPVREGAIAQLGQLLQRLDAQRLPLRVSALSRAMVEGFANGLPDEAASGFLALLDPERANAVLDGAGDAMALFDAVLHNTATPTRLHGSERADVIPGVATVELDGRVLPGSTPEELIEEVRSICGPDVKIELLQASPPPDAEPPMALFPVLAQALVAVDPDAIVIPMISPGVTDGRFLASLGIECYGYTPLALPAGFPLAELIHGANERVPVEALRFGTEVLKEMLRRYGPINARGETPRSPQTAAATTTRGVEDD
jgi:acetylornithine deacetylase/succinyl-diaminopimelate desuccinylase-like protein